MSSNYAIYIFYFPKPLNSIHIYNIYILKELKYATHKNSTVTCVFDVLVKLLLKMSCRLLVTCDEMKKCHFIAKINVKMSKSIEKANCDVNVRAMWKMPNSVYVWLSDVDFKMCNKD